MRVAALFLVACVGGLLTKPLVAQNTTPVQAPSDHSFMPAASGGLSISIVKSPRFPALRQAPPIEPIKDCIPPLRDDERRSLSGNSAVSRSGDFRTGSELRIALSSGESVYMVDAPCGGEHEYYSFLFSAHGFAIVLLALADHHYFLAVSMASGRISPVLIEPVFSPDGTQAVAYRLDRNEGIAKLIIYQVFNDRILIEASCETIIHGPTVNDIAEPRWLSRDKLSFVERNTGALFPDSPTLSREGDVWVLQGPVTFSRKAVERKPFRQICGAPNP